MSHFPASPRPGWAVSRVQRSGRSSFGRDGGIISRFTIQRFNQFTGLLIMSTTSTTKSDYLLLFRGNVWDRGLSPAQIQKVVSDWMAWFERLKEEGKCLGGHPLEEEGKIVSGKQGRTIADGPFAESKEAI